MSEMPGYYHSLSLAAKAGKIVSGEMSTEKAIRAGKAYLVLIAGDASKNTRKAFEDHCAYYQVPTLDIPDRETLGRLIGKENRASAAITDENLAKLVLKQYGKQKK